MIECVGGVGDELAGGGVGGEEEGRGVGELGENFFMKKKKKESFVCESDNGNGSQKKTGSGGLSRSGGQISEGVKSGGKDTPKIEEKSSGDSDDVATVVVHESKSDSGALGTEPKSDVNPDEVRPESFDKTLFEEVLIVPLVVFRPDNSAKNLSPKPRPSEVVTPSNMVTRDHFPVSPTESKAPLDPTKDPQPSLNSKSCLIRHQTKPSKGDSKTNQKALNLENGKKSHQNAR